MGSVAIISAVLTLFAGVGVFLTACETLSSNLETLGSSKLRELFATAAKSKLLGVGIGTLATVVIQSSSAVTVIALGFVSAGIMSLTQAATVIYGANIGTTITGQIVAWGISGGGGVSTTVIFSALTGLGAFIISFSKNDRIKTIGGILCGLGLLFVGLSMMSGAMESFAESEGVRDFLSSFDNIFVLILLGAIFTALIQSSSVMTSICITMVVARLITLNQGIYLSMGANIGTCVSAIMAGMAGSADAKRGSYIHLIFNVFGVVVFTLIGLVIELFTGGAVTYGTIFGSIFDGMPQVQLAMFHTMFNVVAVLLILPLTGVLVALVQRIVPDAPEEPEDAVTTFYIDEGYLVTPPIAVQQVKNEIVSMAGFALRNFESAIQMVTTLDFSDIEEFEHTEHELNYLNRELARYIAKLFGEQLSEADREYLSHALKSISDLERVGDYSKHIVEYARTLEESNESFSPHAVNEVNEIGDMVENLFGQVMRAYEREDDNEVTQAGITNLAISEQAADMANNHAHRISVGICSPDAGAVYLALISDVERIGSHFYNLAKTVL